jgi:hypothetical protein
LAQRGLAWIPTVPVAANKIANKYANMLMI